MVKNTIYTTHRTISYEFPTEWSEISYNTFKGIDFENKKDVFKKLTGLEDKVIEDVRVYKHLDKAFDRLLSKSVSDYTPKEILGVELKSKVSEESIGQYEDSKAAIREDGVDAPPLVVAIYLQSADDYDYKKSVDKAKEVEELPFYEVVNAYNFFLTKSIYKKSTYTSRLLQIFLNIVRRLRHLVTGNSKARSVS